ncbi:MAG TPA: tail fiber protein [Blastocatellia bacterium]|nr:tail fiber protein [Blastocatellia bacterium]
MAEPFIGEIRIFGFNFAPLGWAACNGQLMSIAQNTTLFSILGTTYGGDGKTTFALPNLQSRAPMMWGQGPGLTARDIGESIGTDTVTLLSTQIPAHNHQYQNFTGDGTQQNPTNSAILADPPAGRIYQTDVTSNLTQMSPQAVGLAGGSQPHNNQQPFLTLMFCIALEGVFPVRG